MAATPEHLRQLDRRARRQEATLRRWFLAYIASLRAALTVPVMSSAVATGNATPLTSLLLQIATPMVDMERFVHAEAEAAWTLVGRRQRDRTVLASLDIHDPRFARIAREAGARLVRDVPASVQQTIANTVAAAYRRGAHPAEFAPQLRTTVGLTDRQAIAAGNYRRALLADGRAPERADTLTGRYANRLLRQRSILIARTETMRAANLSRIAGFQIAASQGYIDHDETLVWDATLDENVCPRCEELDGATATVSDPVFDGEDPPPLHPDCRCVVVLDTGGTPDGTGDSSDEGAAGGDAGDAGDGAPATVPVTDELDLSGTEGVLDGNGAPLDEQLAPATAALSSLVRVPVRDRALPVTATIDRDSSRRGEFRVSGHTATEIALNPNSDVPNVTLAHETGHLIDYEAIAQPASDGTRAFASRLAAESTLVAPAVRDALTEWRGAVTSTDAVASIHRLALDGDIPVSAATYLLSEHELFARSFAQWVAVTSNDPVMRAELNQLRERPELRHYLPVQWDDLDFTAVGAALEKVLRAAGLVG